MFVNKIFLIEENIWTFWWLSTSKKMIEIPKPSSLLIMLYRSANAIWNIFCHFILTRKWSVRITTLQNMYLHRFLDIEENSRKHKVNSLVTSHWSHKINVMLFSILLLVFIHRERNHQPFCVLIILQRIYLFNFSLFIRSLQRFKLASTLHFLMNSQNQWPVVFSRLIHYNASCFNPLTYANKNCIVTCNPFAFLFICKFLKHDFNLSDNCN